MIWIKSPSSVRKFFLLLVAWAFLLMLIASFSLARQADKNNTSLFSKLPYKDAPRYFGLYFNEQKVGWMSMAIEMGQKGLIISRTETDFQFVVMGNKTRMRSTEVRKYNPVSGRLQALHASMKGTTGETKLDLVYGQKGSYHLRQTSGGNVHNETIQLAPPITIQDELAAELAIVEGGLKEGQAIVAETFDATMKRRLHVRLKVEAKETKLVGGVDVALTKLSGVIEELSAPIYGWYDERGRLVETLVAGMIKARWEEKRAAQSNISKADFLNATIIKPPKPLAKVKAAKKLQIVFEGLAEGLAIENERQRYETLEGGRRRLVITKELEIPDGGDIDKQTMEKHALPKFMKPSARLQSDDKRIEAIAEKLGKKVKTKRAMAERILQWVYQEMEKTYTPTYSNALEALNTMKGDCGEHAVLFVALARAAGLPAREAAGIVYSEPMGGFGFHAWAEVFLGDQWVSVDPSWGQFPSDVTHIMLAHGGIEEQAKIISVFGGMSILSAKIE